jgi:CRISPR-associated exonuclease Cas4
VTLLVLLLIGAILLYVALTRFSKHERGVVGLRNETVETTDDDDTTSMPVLRSDRYGLVGRPDQLVRVGRALVPVEQKPNARRLYPSHVLQVAAQCLLVQEVYGVRPPYGLVVLAGGERQRVEFSSSLEKTLLETVAEMREYLETGMVPEPVWRPRKCRACGFQTKCWGRRAE